VQPGSLQILPSICIEDSDERLEDETGGELDGAEVREGPGAGLLSLRQALHFQPSGMFLVYD
jgi:hypothetical protein